MTIHDPVLHSTRFQSTESTDGQTRAFWRDGYIAQRGLFRPEEIATWQSECDRLLHSKSVHPDNVRTPFRFHSGSLPERIDPVVDISPVFAALVHAPQIVNVVRAIFDDRAFLFKDKIIFKAPGTDGYTLHQDQAWWQLCAADDILSVSIQIDGATAANGCIELFPGYHDRLRTPAGKMTNFRPEEVAEIDAAKGEKMETQPGDVLIFHSLTPHRSSRNLAEVSRRSLYLTYSAARTGDFYREQQEKYVARLLDESRASGRAFFE